MTAIADRSCCFTGYRPGRFAFSPDGLRPEHIRAALAEQIRRLYREGYRTFITGMCVGVDLWAAAEVLALRATCPDIRLVAAIPFEGQETYWSQVLQREYRRIFEACDEREILFSPECAKMDAARCYRERNRWMVDHAAVVLAVYSDALETTRSGTAATVHYARRQLRRIVYIHPQTLAVSEETVHQLQFPL